MFNSLSIRLDTRLMRARVQGCLLLLKDKARVLEIKEQARLEKGLPHVPVLRAALLPPGGLLPSDPLALIHCLDTGLWLGLE